MKTRHTAIVWALVALGPILTLGAKAGFASDMGKSMPNAGLPQGERSDVESAAATATATAAGNATVEVPSGASDCPPGTVLAATARPPFCAAQSPPPPQVNAKPDDMADLDDPAQVPFDGRASTPSFYAGYLAPDRIPRVALAPSLRIDSALAASAGLALMFKLWGDCGHMCGGQFLFLDGELGMFGRQVRFGLAQGVIGPLGIRYLLLNGLGFSVAGAYLHRFATFDGKLATPEDYGGATVALTLVATVRLGVYMGYPKGLFTASIGLGF